MEYRKLGKTGWNVSIIGYGAAPLGGVYGKLNEKKGIRSVHTAVDLGINFIDTAPYYGTTVSETVLGKALKDIPRERYYLSTKLAATVSLISISQPSALSAASMKVSPASASPTST